MSLDRTKYDIELNGTAYQITNMSKDSAPDFAPRFGTGSEGESDLDLLKSTSIQDFEGGMLQVDWLDDQMVRAITNGSYDVYNKYLYPSVAKTELATLAGAPTVSGEWLAWTRYASEDYIIGKMWNVSAWYSRLYDQDGNQVDTTTAAFYSSAEDIRSMFSDDQYLYVLWASGIERWDGTTWSTYSATAAAYGATLGGTIYTVSGTGLLKSDNGSGTFTNVGRFGPKGTPYFLVNYQNRLYCGTDSGLYAYDGTDIYPVLEGQITSGKEFRGWLYLASNGKLARFNSITYEELYDINQVGTIIGQFAGGIDRLYIALNKSQKWTGGGTDTDTSLLYFDGVGLYEYASEALTNITATAVAGQDSPILLTVGDGTNVQTGYAYKYDQDNEYAIGDTGVTFNDLIIETSRFNGGFANVPKTLHRIEVDFLDDTDPDVDQAGTLEVTYSDRYGQWTDWSTVGTITSITGSVVDLETPVEFYTMQIRFTADSSNNRIAIRRISFRYTLHPDRRMRWRVGLLCQGTDDYHSATLRDGVEETRSPKSLRESVYATNRSNTPVWLYEADYGLLGTVMTDSTTGNITITGGTDMFKDSGSIRIGTEIIKYGSKTSTQLNVTERGAYGTSAAAHAVTDVVEPAYRVYLTEIVNERYLLDENTLNQQREQPDYGLESEIQVQLEEV